MLYERSLLDDLEVSKSTLVLNCYCRIVRASISVLIHVVILAETIGIHAYIKAIDPDRIRESNISLQIPAAYKSHIYFLVHDSAYQKSMVEDHIIKGFMNIWSGDWKQGDWIYAGYSSNDILVVKD